MFEALSLIVAAIGVSYGVYRDQIARRERRKREAAEEQLRQEKERREELLSQPDVMVELTGHDAEAGGLGHHLAALVVENKGSNVARNVTFGLRYGEREFVAGNDGTPGTLPALGERERVVWIVRIPLDVMGALRGGQERLETVMVPWARFSDKLGNQHEIQAKPLP